MIFIIIFLSILGAALYRLGGIGKPFNTFYRDAGTSLCGATILFLQHPSWDWKIIGACILTWGLGWGSMTTYFKKKGTDATWVNWLLVGLAFGFVPIFYALVIHLWIPFIIRFIILTILIPLWCQLINWDDLEEGGRGFLFCITLLLF